MKKILALLLAVVMVTCLFAGCKKSGGETSTNPADAIADEMTSSDGKYAVAFVTDVGQLKDKSFNQGTYDGVKLYANEAGKSYKYYQPAGGSNSTDDDRYNAMKLAADNGAEVIVAAGFMQAAALTKAAIEYPNIRFVFIDGWAIADENGNMLNNVTGIAFHEEQCGYLAGYAAVMEGYTKLGFTGGGGGSNDACLRYGYGYVQGAEAAAAIKNVNVEMKYSWLYGSQFQPSNELQTQITGWYQNGTEVVFACGGAMFASVSAAASASDGKVIGVDVDQSFQSETVITSALKGIGEAAKQALKAAESDSTWADFGGKSVNLGAAENAVGLPVATWSLKNWSVDDYNKLFADIVSGKVEIKADAVAEPANTEHVTLSIDK